MMSLKGKTLFITGASRGIGLAIAIRAARDGANIVIAAKTVQTNPKLPGTIYSAAAEIEAAGGQALPVQTDIRDDAAYLILTSDAKTTTGNFFIDDALLAQHGVTDLERYSVSPGTKQFIPDFFVD